MAKDVEKIHPSVIALRAPKANGDRIGTPELLP